MKQAIEIEGIQVSPHHYIGGQRVASSQTFTNYCPIDGHVIGEIAAGLPEHCESAVAAAEEAFPAWAALGPEQRRTYLYRFAAEIRVWGDKLARVECEDNGMLLARLRGHQIERCAQNIEYFADEAVRLADTAFDGEKAHHDISHEPAGVALLITPWNSPMMLTTWKLGPALAAGNTVVVKPPEWAPLTCSMFGDIADAAGLPKGVLNIVQGIGAETGAQLVSDPRLARISFTGSVPTAKQIGQSAAANLIPASFELGGKSPFIVLANADLQVAAETAALQYRNAGQVCLAGTRLLVDESVAEEFLEQMHATVERLRVGDPRDPATEIGPIIHPRQFTQVEGFVKRAVADGAEVLWGGAAHEAGDLYYQPTLLKVVDQEAEIVQNEVFGPVLVIQTFRDDDEAVTLANGTRYGLAGVVFGENDRAKSVADRLRTGMVWVNSFFLRDLNAPFGGIRDSGIGREGGQWSFEFFCDIRDVMTSHKPYRPVFAGG
ncbi:aldehyde dehydrogenase family protein [Vreelandella sp. EE27]